VDAANAAVVAVAPVAISAATDVCDPAAVATAVLPIRVLVAVVVAVVTTVAAAAVALKAAPPVAAAAA
jgi:hypothetical protein